MKIITYNGSVARLCGANGIIKAVLLNYIYNFHKSNTRKGPGHPAQIPLEQFVYQYRHQDAFLWGRSCIHERLADLILDRHLNKAGEPNSPVYSVSDEIATLLNSEEAPIVSFDLGQACEEGIHVAIMNRYLRHVIRQSPDGVAYGLDVEKMADVNRLSPAQIYRAIKYLVEDKKALRKVKCRVKGQQRALALSLA